MWRYCHIFYNIASHNLGKMLLAYRSIFFLFLKHLDLPLQVCFSRADGKLLLWQELVKRTHLRNSLQSAQAAFRLHLWYSQSRVTASLCEGMGREEYCCLGKYMRNADWYLWDFKYSWIQRRTKPSFKSRCLCSPNCQLVPLSPSVTALCIVCYNLWEFRI